MLNLNLPPFEYKLKKAEGKLWIFDIIRKKYVVLLPEEWVRQHFIHYLIDHLKYPRTMIKVEGGLVYNQLKKRSDLVVFDRQGKPWLVVECKSPQIKLSHTSVLQAAVYNATLRAKYIIITNGLDHHYSSINWDTGLTEKMTSIPLYNDV